MKSSVRQLKNQTIRLEVEKAVPDNNAFYFAGAYNCAVISIDLPPEEWKKIIKKLIKQLARSNNKK